jgi:hypothetical protein
MRAELVLMGRRIDMAPRAHRRTLVILIYSTLAALMAGACLLDRWRATGFYLVLATFLMNRLFLGGYNFGGLVKPFNGKPPRRSEVPPPFLLLALRVYRPEPGENEYRNDERELARRDRAHYQAYQALTMGLALMWLLADWRLYAPRLVAWLPGGADLAIYGLILAGILLSLTLPQVILLWSEPDMEEDLAD